MQWTSIASCVKERRTFHSWCFRNHIFVPIFLCIPRIITWLSIEWKVIRRVCMVRSIPRACWRSHLYKRENWFKGIQRLISFSLRMEVIMLTAFSSPSSWFSCSPSNTSLFILEANTREKRTWFMTHYPKNSRVHYAIHHSKGRWW